MTPCFLAEFRRHLQVQRFLRKRRRTRFEDTMKYTVGNVCVSHPGLYVVWIRTPKCGHVRRVVSEWDYLSAAIYSASLLFLRLQNESAMRNTVQERTT